LPVIDYRSTILSIVLNNLLWITPTLQNLLLFHLSHSPSPYKSLYELLLSESLCSLSLLSSLLTSVFGCIICCCCSLECILKECLKVDFVLRFTEQRMEISTRWKLVFCLHEHIPYWQLFLTKYSRTVLNAIVLIVGIVYADDPISIPMPSQDKVHHLLCIVTPGILRSRVLPLSSMLGVDSRQMRPMSIMDVYTSGSGMTFMASVCRSFALLRLSKCPVFIEYRKAL